MKYERETVRCLISKYKGKYGIEYIGTIHYRVRMVECDNDEIKQVDTLPETIVESVIAKNNKRCMKKVIKLVKKLDNYYGIKKGGM